MTTPRVPLYAMAGLGVVALLITGGARLAGIEPVQVRRAPIAAAADLRFADLADGSVQVVDAHDGRVVDTLPPQSNAFLRTVMRGFAQARVRAGIDDQQPFRIERNVDAHLSLSDPVTGRRVELNPFGEINAETFGRLIPADAQRTRG